MSDKEISQRIKEGIRIDAPLSRSIQLAFDVLEREGYNPETDCVDLITQHENQLTTVKYMKTVTPIDEKTGQKYISRHYMIAAPDRYVPAKNAPQGVIRSEKDIY